VLLGLPLSGFLTAQQPLESGVGLRMLARTSGPSQPTRPDPTVGQLAEVVAECV
jgi:hypothetical protein